MTPSEQNGTSNGTASTACRGRALVPAPDSSVNPVELNDLARELAGAFGGMVKQYREHYKLSAQEALDRAQDDSDEYLDRILSAPPDQVSWYELDALARRDEGQALRRWREIVQAARDEVRSGHRAARTVEWSEALCWQRARFLALRAELADAWRPRNQLEQHLIDQLAQFQTRMEHWQEKLTTYTMFSGLGARRRERDGLPPEPPQLTVAQAVDQAAAMVERWHRLFLRTLGALQSQRRRGRTGIVRRAGQVNVAHQQVNVTVDGA
jgi:hypothetical protein